MFGIGGFFKKIQNSFAKEFLVREAVREAILKQTGADLPLSVINFRSSTVILGSGVSQSLKSAIYIKKTSILKEIADKQTGRMVTDIR